MPQNKFTEFSIKDLKIGGNNKVVIQSMLNIPLENERGCIAQIIELKENGCEMVRAAVINKGEVAHLISIVKELEFRNFNIPIVADVHFNSKLANDLVGIVDKIRINPGNYAGNPKRAWNNSTDALELKKITRLFKEFLSHCKKHGTAIRIGVNHGSLSDRILYKYGNTALGMVHSVLEFARICKTENFDKVVISLKSNDVFTNIESNVLLIKMMQEEDMSFPIHLGITESGNNLQGRVKSTYGISTLLNSGIGNTIRVSLTENPVNEIDIAQSILKNFGIIRNFPIKFKNKEVVLCSNTRFKTYDKSDVYFQFKNDDNQLKVKSNTPKNESKFNTIICLSSIQQTEAVHEKFDWVFVDSFHPETIQKQSGKLIFDSVELLMKYIEVPSLLAKAQLILKIHMNEANYNDFIVKATNITAPLLLKNIIQGIWISSDLHSPQYCDELGLEILQLVQKVNLQPTYVSCPGCSRTLFDIEKVSAEIESKTKHLNGIKIGVMGCVINGIGEMNEADYGYVGAGKDRINLYKGENCVKRNVPSQNAVQELLELISTHQPLYS